jgi:hypothetical protein
MDMIANDLQNAMPPNAATWTTNAYNL